VGRSVCSACPYNPRSKIDFDALLVKRRAAVHGIEINGAARGQPGHGRFRRSEVLGWV
jgi:hypothetical protein